MFSVQLPINFGALRRQLSVYCEQNFKDEGRVIARCLIEDLLNCSAKDMLGFDADRVDRAQIRALQARLHRLNQGETLARIRGWREFWGLRIGLNSATLEPRPDSETLVEAAIQLYQSLERQETLLDLCTGSGALLCAIMQECAFQTGFGSDISNAALQQAKLNFYKHNGGQTGYFINSDFFQHPLQPADMVVCNPPYIARDENTHLDANVIANDPHAALFADENGYSFYNHLVEHAYKYVRRQGILILETGFQQSDIVLEKFQHKYKNCKVCKHYDLNNIARAISIKF